MPGHRLAGGFEARLLIEGTLMAEIIPLRPADRRGDGEAIDDVSRVIDIPTRRPRSAARRN